MEAARTFARGTLALAAFLLLFFAIANAAAGRALVAGLTMGSGLVATVYLVRTRT